MAASSKPEWPFLMSKYLRGGKPILGDAEAGRAIPEDDELGGVFVWKRAKQKRAGDAEDGSVSRRWPMARDKIAAIEKPGFFGRGLGARRRRVAKSGPFIESRFICGRFIEISVWGS